MLRPKAEAGAIPLSTLMAVFPPGSYQAIEIAGRFIPTACLIAYLLSPLQPSISHQTVRPMRPPRAPSFLPCGCGGGGGGGGGLSGPWCCRPDDSGGRNLQNALAYAAGMICR